MLHGTTCPDKIGTSRFSGENLYLRKFCLIIISLALVSIHIQAQNGWTQKANIPTPRPGATAGVINDKIFLIGGWPNSNTAVNEVYDPSTNTWESKTLMPTARGFLSSAVVNDTIYTIGGGYPTPTNKNEAYNPATNSWTIKANMNVARINGRAGVVNGIIYVIAGYPNERSCEAYNPQTNTWTSRSNFPESIGGVVSVAVFNELVYVFGGGYYNGLKTVYAYNPQTDTWTKKSDMLTPRTVSQACLVNGKIYVIGGATSEYNPTDAVEEYDPVNDTWTTKSPMPVASAFLSCAVVNNKIYVFEGVENWSGTTGGLKVWEYDPAFHTDIAAGNVSGTWTKANSPYFINGEITIPNGETLTIEPGVEVVFKGHYKFNVQGRLLAVGTQQDSISFTAENTGTGWHGIRFINTPNTNDLSNIVFCSFRYGKANTGSGLDRSGGAIMINGYSNVLISDCLFEYNMTSGDISTTGGPGVCIFNGSPTVTKSTFINNAGTSAGAIKIDFKSDAIISNNFIVNNTSYCGAVLCAYQSDNRPTISGNFISNNTASAGGGGIFVYSSSNPRIENNIIIHNQAPIGGGIYCLTNANPVLINNTIAYNNATNGGGIYCETNSDPILINNILYGNSATTGKQVFINDAQSDPHFLFCDIQGGKDGFGGSGAGAMYAGLYQDNIDNDPSFTNTLLDDYRLSDLSPCIGAGIDSIEVAGVWYKAPQFCFNGNLRPSPFGSKPDVGGCENLLALPVPVELISFTVTADGKEVTLNWSTATELNNHGFEIQRKAFNSDFATIAFVKGQGTTTQKNDYSFADRNLDEGKYFYRLKQMDYDGKHNYSATVEVDVRLLDKFALDQNYPNPFNPTTTIGYILQEKCNARLTLLNTIGEEIAVLVNEEQDKGYHKVGFNGSKLTSGVYFYRIQTGNFVDTKKLILLR